MKRISISVLVLALSVLSLSCGNETTLLTIHSSNYKAIVNQLKPLAGFDPNDIRILAGEKDGDLRRIIEVEGSDSVSLDFISESVLVAKEMGLPTDQPGYFTLIADISNHEVGDLLIRRGIPFIKYDTLPESSILDSLWNISIYRSTSQKQLMYLVNRTVIRADFPMIVAFWGTDTVTVKTIDSESATVAVNWTSFKETQKFELQQPQASNKREVLTLIS